MYKITFLTKNMSTVETLVDQDTEYGAVKTVSTRKDFDLIVSCELLGIEESALAKAGYFIRERDPKVNPEFQGAFILLDSQDVDGYAIVGDDRLELIKEAHAHLFDDAVATDQKMDYTITIKVDVTANSPEEAAQFALDDIRDKSIKQWNVDVEWTLEGTPITQTISVDESAN
jgi:hypothetical protein